MSTGKEVGRNMEAIMLLESHVTKCVGNDKEKNEFYYCRCGCINAMVYYAGGDRPGFPFREKVVDVCLNHGRT